MECIRIAKSGPVFGRNKKAITPARCGWNADRAQPFLVIAKRDASSISDDRQKKADRFWSAPRKRTPRPDAAGMPIAHRHRKRDARETRAAFQTTGRKREKVWSGPRKRKPRPKRGGMADADKTSHV